MQRVFDLAQINWRRRPPKRISAILPDAEGKLIVHYEREAA
jgi:hypothetical protein